MQNLMANKVDDPQIVKLEFNHAGALKTKGPALVMNELIRWLLVKDEVYVNWANVHNKQAVCKMVCIVLSDFNGQLLRQAITKGKLDSLKYYDNKPSSIDFVFNK